MTDDLKRLKQEYARRRDFFSESNRYASLNPAFLYAIQQRQRATVDLLRQCGFTNLRDLRILEIGCGGGDVLQEYMWHRLRPRNLYGVDLLPDRLHAANQRFPGINLAQCDARFIPYADNSFDFTLQYTVHSSILDDAVKDKISHEMLRVTRTAIIWYDFWLNPANPQTRGIRKAEIRRLFPSCHFIFKKITLAPPLARRIVPLSWTLAHILEKLTFLNTHYLVLIRPD